MTQATRSASWLHRYKPAASVPVHLLLAASMWTVVGTVLAVVGVVWCWPLARTHWWMLLLAVVVGWAKGRWVLDRTAERMVRRIRERGDGKCVLGFQSWRSWLFVLGMMALGKWLRSGALPHPYVGLLYVAVGLALVTSTRQTWRAWWVSRRERQG